MGIELGKAYVTVIPEMKGAQAAIGRELGDSSVGAKAGESVGSGFSSKLGSLAKKGAIAAAAAAGAALVSVTKQSLEAFASFEQLEGGVQKIFNEADISGIMADAQNAYKDLNMSANQYLESINQVGAAFAATMGDQKGYDVARTGMKAISDYASGTGRNLDELNEKYALITRSTSSYQSIADQFSGILPATSADFLAQAQAAGLLSDSYKSLTDVPVAEYQEALTMMLEKGVDDMGLAGNTAAETAGTISGSLAALSSEWQNWLVAIADSDADVEAETQRLVDSIVAVAQNVVPRIGQIAKSLLFLIPGMEELVNWFNENVVPIIMPAMEMIADYITNTVVPAVQNAISAIQPVVQGFLDMLVPLLLNIVNFISTTVIPVVIEVSKFLVNAFQEVYTALSPIIDGIVQVVGGAFETISGIITTVMGIIKGIVTGDWQMASDGVNSILSGLQGIVSGIWNAISGIVQGVMSTISGIIMGAWNAISSTVSGVINGIASTVSGVFNSITSTIRGAMDTAKNVVKGAIDAIGNFFANLKLELPHIDLPHFNISGGEPPWGIAGQGSLPNISIDWYAKGTFVDGATLVGIGAGEKGAEAILPKTGGLMDEFSENLTRHVNNADVIHWLNDNLGNVIAAYSPTATPRELRRINQKVNAYA